MLRLQTKLRILNFTVASSLLVFTLYTYAPANQKSQNSSQNKKYETNLLKDGNLPDHVSSVSPKKYSSPNPVSKVTYPKDMSKISAKLTVISGTASSSNAISKVKLSIYDATNNLYWDGSKWSIQEIWIDACGNDSWQYNFTIPQKEYHHIYEVKSKAIDSQGKEEKAKKKGNTFTVVP